MCVMRKNQKHRKSINFRYFYIVLKHASKRVLLFFNFTCVNRILLAIGNARNSQGEREMCDGHKLHRMHINYYCAVLQLSDLSKWLRASEIAFFSLPFLCQKPKSNKTIWRLFQFNMQLAIDLLNQSTLGRLSTVRPTNEFLHTNDLDFHFDDFNL